MSFPSKSSPGYVINVEIRSRVGRRLGVALCEEVACPFCFCTLDKWGYHAECSCQGVIKQQPTIVSDTLYIHATGAGAVAVLEAADVLNVLGIPGQEGERGAGDIATSRERPADV